MTIGRQRCRPAALILLERLLLWQYDFETTISAAKFQLLDIALALMFFSILSLCWQQNIIEVLLVFRISILLIATPTRQAYAPELLYLIGLVSTILYLLTFVSFPSSTSSIRRGLSSKNSFVQEKT